MKNNDERIEIDVGAWAGEDIRLGLERFQNANFEDRLRRQLAGRKTGAFWRRLAPAVMACFLLSVVIGTVVSLRRPLLQPVSGRESIRTFFADYSTLRRLQKAPDAIIGSARVILLPGTRAERLSRQEMSELFRSTMPWRDLSAGQLGKPGAPYTGPQELKQTIDRFFSITLKSIKEET